MTNYSIRMFRRNLVSSEYIFHVEIHNTEEIFLRQPESQFLRKFLELITKKRVSSIIP